MTKIKAICSSCGKDRGFVEKRALNKTCLSCSRTKHSKNISNVDYNNFIKETGKPIKYKMSCNICGKDKGYKPIAYHDRRCIDCSNAYLSKIKTKKSEKQRKIKHTISSSIGERLRKRKSSKNGNSILEKLPYTIEELITHLESQFEPWMSWDNYGRCDSNNRTWNIDHIIPDASFSYESMDDEEFQKCWSLDNLRPYDSIKNSIKGDNSTL